MFCLVCCMCWEVEKNWGGGSVIEWGYPEAALLIANSGLLGEALQKNLDVEDHCEQERIFYALSLALVVASHVPENHVELLVWQPGRTCVESDSILEQNDYCSVWPVMVVCNHLRKTHPENLKPLRFFMAACLHLWELLLAHGINSLFELYKFSRSTP